MVSQSNFNSDYRPILRECVTNAYRDNYEVDIEKEDDWI
jgi:hypothetical protein